MAEVASTKKWISRATFCSLFFIKFFHFDRDNGNFFVAVVTELFYIGGIVFVRCRSHAERSAASGVPEIERGSGSGAPQDQESDPLGESRTATRSSLSASPTCPEQSAKYHSMGVQGEMRQRYASKGQGKPN